MGSGMAFGLGFVSLKGWGTVGSYFFASFKSVFSEPVWVYSNAFTKSLFLPVAFCDNEASKSATKGRRS